MHLFLSISRAVAGALLLVILFMMDTGALAPSASPSGSGAEPAAAREGTTPGNLQGLLQKFVDKTYRRGFLELGEERDCDHGHLLYSAGARLPFAILYHTQELGGSSRPSLLNREARNWLQRVDTGRVEDARLYVRSAYPAGAYWNWFSSYEIPRYKQHHTIVPEMLDPELLRADIAHSRQWQFTRVTCSRPAPGQELAVRLPGQGKICLESQLQ